MVQAELRALRQAQQAMAKDIAEIKQLLEPLRAPAPVRPAEGRVEAAGWQERGNPRASVVMVEFSDFQCPYCKRHVDATLPKIAEAYINTGRIRYIFVDYPLVGIHPQAFKAAESAHCAAEQERYWEMHARLFASQGALDRDQLLAHAEALGLDAARFATCLDSGRYAGRVKAGLEQGDRLGIDGTPAILLGLNRNGSIEAVQLIVGAQPFEVLKQEIDALLATPARQPDG
jgi:protein-disulfide isomerase